ncbi:MAG: hypothetical protein IPP14_13750 [Planctomycetes bacterium]|nr:hypothetical protein [Planctomycetota bacterium]
MKRTLVAVLLFTLALVANASAQAENAQPDWRTVRATKAFLWQYYEKDSKRYDLPPVALLHHFAEVAKVSLRVDERAVSTMNPLTLVLGEGVEAPALFDLCQLALSPRFMVVPEAGVGRFGVVAATDLPSRAPRFVESELDTLSSQEWGWLQFDLGGRDLRTVERALTPMRTISAKLEGVNDNRSILVLETATNLRKFRDLLPTLDRPREVVPLVPYQRAAQSEIGKLVTSLRAYLKLFAYNSGIREETVSLNWDLQSGVVSGMIPKPLAQSIDAAIEAADALQNKRDTEAAASDKRFVLFTLASPADMTVVQFSARLRLLFETEAGLGDARFVARDDKQPTLLIRCRPWLEAEIKDAAALMGK